MKEKIKTIHHHKGEVLEELSKERLIEIIMDLVWEAERLRQASKR